MRWQFVISSIVVTSAIKIDPMKDEFAEIKGKDIDKSLMHSRENGVSAVWFYKNTGEDTTFQKDYNELAKKTKNMLKLVAVDCNNDINEKACASAMVDSTPHIMIYPPLPMSPFKYLGEPTLDSLEKALVKQLPSHLIKNLKTVDEYKEFTKKNPTKPKVILYSDKKKAPPILKGLSTELVYSRTFEFAFVGSESPEVLNESGASNKKLPALVVVSKGKPSWYREKEFGKMTFQNVYSYLSPFSESGMGDTVKGGEAASEIEMEEPEYERLREIKDRTQKELCFGQKNVCGILLSEGKPSDKYIDTVANFESRFASKSERGVKFNWMWLDINIETEFKKAIEDMEPKLAEKEGRDAETLKYPTMIFVKPPKKKREEKLLTYVKLPNDATVDATTVDDMVDKISGGASYARSDLPKFINRKAAAKAAAKAEL